MLGGSQTSAASLHTRVPVLLEGNLDLYLDEITSELHHQHSINASISAVWQMMAALRLR
jgi:hypothetical protein